MTVSDSEIVLTADQGAAGGVAWPVADADALATLADLLTELQSKLAEGGTVALDAGTLAALETITASVTGEVALDAPTLAALEAVTATVGNFPTDYPDSAVAAALGNIQTAIDGLLTDTQIRATPLPVSGTVSVGNFPATQPVSGSVAVSNLPATQPVSGTVNAEDSGERAYTHVVATITTTGDTTVHTPAAGKAIRLRWIYAINDPSATTPPLIKVKLGATEIYRVWALSKRQLVDGAVDVPLVINLTGTGNVAITALLEEV